jgi:tripartite-type tricarboxylate transporter receptor subunit TctC
MITDLVGGQIDFAFEPASVLIAHIHDEKMRPIAVTSPQRLKQIPGVPALAETVPNFVSISWSGIVAPVGTPAPIIRKLNTAINTELASGEMSATLTRLAADVRPGTPEDFAAFIATEAPKWAAVVTSSGLKLE